MSTATLIILIYISGFVPDYIMYKKWWLHERPNAIWTVGDRARAIKSCVWSWIGFCLLSLFLIGEILDKNKNEKASW